MEKDTIFWDVDTQFDFMQPDGKLYIPGAEEIIDRISEVRKFALDNGFSIVASTDWHSRDNDEITDDPDYELTFPPHCMAGESGSERVGFLGEVPVEYVETEEIETDALQKLIDKDQFHIVIRKETVDVFSNPNTHKLVELLKPQTIAVFGVSLDICVYHTVHMLAKSRHDGTTLFLLKDAVKGLGAKPEAEILDEIEQMGVEITAFGDFKRQLSCG